MDPGSINGDEWLTQLVRRVKLDELQLIGPKVATQTNGGLSSWATAPLSWVGIASVGSSRQTTAAPANGKSAGPLIKTSPLVINPHHLFYLLIRFEALGLPAGSLDTCLSNLPAPRPVSYYVLPDVQVRREGPSGLGHGRRSDKSDTMSFTSLRSAFGSSSVSAASWWTAPRHPQQDITRDLKLLFSLLTKLPALRIAPTPGTKLIKDFENDCPGRNGIPMDVFKSLSTLQMDGTDPRGLLGWDRLCIQLVALSIHHSGLEDLSDLLIDAVVHDCKRRKGENVDDGRRKVIYSPNGSAGNDDSSSPLKHEAAHATDAASNAPPSQTPSLAWYFLRHLSLANNSLTFIPEEPLSQLCNLSSLDLSSNLLNSVPPSLHLLPRLVSLNVSDNLIDSVLGISSTIPTIRTLIISKNRLESLCGLERLKNLTRIDLRHNYIFDVGEVGRLAQITPIEEVYVEGNPIVEELPDWRIDLFLQFAREGQRIKINGSEPGYFEKQRITERLPDVGRLRFTDSPESMRKAPRHNASHMPLSADDESREGLIKVALVKSVHRSRIASRRRAESTTARDSSKERPRCTSHAADDEFKGDRRRNGSDTSSTRSVAVKMLADRKRNKRIVELDSPNSDWKQNPKTRLAATRAENGPSHMITESTSAAESHSMQPKAEGSDYAAMSDSEAIKAAVHAGQKSLAASPLIMAVDGKPTERGRPTGMPKLATKDALSKKADAQAGVSSSAVTTQVDTPGYNLENGPLGSDVDLAKAVLQNLSSVPSTASVGIADSSGTTPSSPLRPPRTLSRTVTTDDDVIYHVDQLRSPKGQASRRNSGASGVLSAQRAVVATASMHEAPSLQHRNADFYRRSSMEHPEDLDPSHEALAFRKGIEALKGEMGDDWLTMLAKGVYNPNGIPTLGRTSGKAAAAEYKTKR